LADARHRWHVRDRPIFQNNTLMLRLRLTGSLRGAGGSKRDAKRYQYAIMASGQPDANSELNTHSRLAGTA
jgi:hypothetical protein